MREKLNEAKALIDAGEKEAAKSKIDEVLSIIPEETRSDSDRKPTIGGGGSGLPIKKVSKLYLKDD